MNEVFDVFLLLLFPTVLWANLFKRKLLYCVYWPKAVISQPSFSELALVPISSRLLS